MSTDNVFHHPAFSNQPVVNTVRVYNDSRKRKVVRLTKARRMALKQARELREREAAPGQAPQQLEQARQDEIETQAVRDVLCEHIQRLPHEHVWALQMTVAGLRTFLLPKEPPKPPAA
jgi:hypothetical protein